MCGIAGMIGKDTLPEAEKVRQMLDVIRHRGPDGEGLYCDGQVAFGHRRLAILDLRPEGNQPMTYRERYVITYNGEVYNYIELRTELEALGHTFSTQTDTEVILAAYAQWGPACVQRFNGMWGFAIYDKQAQTVFCSRDRFGVKPFYYWDAPEAFYFGSEIKELWLHMPKPVKANRGILLAYLTTGEQNYCEQTFFDGVYQLPGGCNLQYDLRQRSFAVTQWYRLPQVPAGKPVAYGAAVKEFRQKFRQAVRLRLRSDVPVGCTLSGGLDSSAITCTINQLKPAGKPLHTISSCFEEKKFDEQEYIDAVIAHTGGVESHKVWPDIHFDLQHSMHCIWHQDEPGGGTAGAAVYEEARRLGMPVMLVGEGADEQLAGYTNFFEALFLDLFCRGHWKQLAQQLKMFKTVREPLDHVSLKHLLFVSAADAILPVRVRDHVRTHRAGYAAARFYKKAALDHPEVYRARNLYSKLSAREVVKTYLFCEMPRILHGLDRVSMQYSVETRAPFLDIELVEALYRMPLEYKLWDGVTKRVMRDAVGQDMPDKVTYRYGKMGFMSPEFQWFYQDPEKITELLVKACDKLEEYVDKQAVMQWCEEHKKQQATAGTEDYLIASLFEAALWMELFQVEL